MSVKHECNCKRQHMGDGTPVYEGASAPETSEPDWYRREPCFGPRPPETSCPKCKHPTHAEFECPYLGHPRLGLPCICNYRPVTQPSPATAGELTREEFAALCDDLPVRGKIEPWRSRIFHAHDDALRARVDAALRARARLEWVIEEGVRESVARAFTS